MKEVHLKLDEAAKYYEEKIASDPNTTFHSIAELFGVKESSLKSCFYRQNNVPNRRGRPHVMSESVEYAMREAIQNEHLNGNTLTVRALGPVARAVLKKAAEGTPNSKIPSSSTILRFIQREIVQGHLTKKNVRKVEFKHNSDMTREAILENMKNLEEVFDRFPVLRKEPGRITNADEKPLSTNFKAYRSPQGIITNDIPKEVEPCVSAPAAGTKHITFLGSIDATGRKGPRLYVIQAEVVPSDLLERHALYGFPSFIGDRDGE
jgi:hypothetical protein